MRTEYIHTAYIYIHTRLLSLLLFCFILFAYKVPVQILSTLNLSYITTKFRAVVMFVNVRLHKLFYFIQKKCHKKEAYAHFRRSVTLHHTMAIGQEALALFPRPPCRCRLYEVKAYGVEVASSS